MTPHFFSFRGYVVPRYTEIKGYNKDRGFHNGIRGHGQELPILHYHEIIIIYPYPILVVINQLFSCIIFINDFICILTGSPG